jgi:tetratricopeptide (TPR) repeat protein
VKALAIDDTLAEAHTSLAHVKFLQEWNWTEAEAEFKRAIELNPNYVTAYHWYGVELTVLGRFDEAHAALKKAQEIDPFSPIISSQLGWLFYNARQHDRAIRQYRETLEMHSSFWVTHLFLGLAYEQRMMYKEALAEFRIARRLSGGHVETLSLIGHINVLLGKKDEAQKILEKLIKQSRREYVSPLAIALIYVGMNDKDRPFEWLEKAYEERDLILLFYHRFPQLDGIRSDPRFADLMQRMRLAL